MKKNIFVLLISSFIFASFHSPTSAHAQIEPFIGQVMFTGASFCPRGWSDMDGRILPISEYSALFSLLGTTYGGDGQSTFALPDLRGRFPLSQGAGPGLTQHTQGEKSGTEQVTITVNQLPSHSHSLVASTGNASQTTPTGNFLASAGAYRASGGTATALSPSSISATGGGLPVNIMPPYSVLRACIALEGVYPSRN